MAKQIKGITCCGDCVYYDWKKHKCSRGASVVTDARRNFYDDCPIPDIDFQSIRNEAITEFAERIKFHLNGIRLNYDDAFGSTVAYKAIEDSKEMVDEIAEQLKGGAIDE